MSAWEGGKGSKQRPTDLNKYESNWDRIFGKKPDVLNNDAMWKHECKQNGTVYDMMVGKGEHCSWCGLNENGDLD